METIQNIKKVSLIFFVITGILHFGSSIFIANLLYLKQAIIINKTIDIPFIITGLIYGAAAFRETMTKGNSQHKILDLTLISIIIVVLISLIAVNLIVPDLK